MRPFPWADAMRFGFGVLRLSPDAFWSLSVRELHAAMEAHAPQRPTPERADLTALQERYPDRMEPKHEQ